MRGLFIKGVTPAAARAWLLVVGALWSTGGLLIKLIPWSAIAIASLRSLTTALLMLAYIGPKRIRVNGKSLTIGLLVAAFIISYVAACKLTTAMNAVMLQYTSPVFTLVITALFFRAKVKKSDVFIVALAMGGIALFFLEKLSAGGMAGNLLGLLSGIGYAGVFIFSARYADEAVHGIFLGHALCFFVGLPFLIAQPPAFTAVSTVTVIAMGIFQIGLPYIIFGEVMRYTTPLDATVITMIEPLLNPVWVLIGTGETPGLSAIIGGLVVLAAILLKALLGAGQKGTRAAETTQRQP